MIRERINKVIANYGVCSRRKVDLMIRDKKIVVNGEFALIGMKVNPDFDDIYVNGKELKKLNKKRQVILLNKPKFVLSSCLDKHNRKTVIDLLPKQFKQGFFPIGRLDFLSRGALLITNDGHICYHLTHPKFEHKKIYIVRMNGELNKNDLEKWKSGINLDGRNTNPCKIDLIRKDSITFDLKITLSEGRNRQIRRIASSFGYKVTDLQRINFANISLDNLKEGDWKLIHNSKFENMR